MSVKIRLRRMGTKGKPFYRVVVADSRSPRDGRFIETIGTYDPRTDPATIKIDEEKALMWMGRGAQATDTTQALLKKQGLVDKFLASKTGAAPAAAPVEAEEKKPVARKRKTTTTSAEQTAAETPVEEPVTAETEAAAEEQPKEEQE